MFLSFWCSQSILTFECLFPPQRHEYHLITCLKWRSAMTPAASARMEYRLQQWDWIFSVTLSLCLLSAVRRYRAVVIVNTVVGFHPPTTAETRKRSQRKSHGCNYVHSRWMECVYVILQIIASRVTAAAGDRQSATACIYVGSNSDPIRWDGWTVVPQ